MEKDVCINVFIEPPDPPDPPTKEGVITKKKIVASIQVILLPPSSSGPSIRVEVLPPDAKF